MNSKDNENQTSVLTTSTKFSILLQEVSHIKLLQKDQGQVLLSVRSVNVQPEVAGCLFKFSTSHKNNNTFIDVYGSISNVEMFLMQTLYVESPCLKAFL